MKKLFFVAVIAAAMVSCTESAAPVVNQDSINAANLADSLAKAAAATAPAIDSLGAKVDSLAAKVDTATKMK
jgi:hypothetical protein